MSESRIRKLAEVSESRIRKSAEVVVYKWKLQIDPVKLPALVSLPMENELVNLIEEALRVEYDNVWSE